MTGLICPCGESVPSSQHKLVKLVGAGKAKQTTYHVLRRFTDGFLLHQSENQNVTSKGPSVASVGDSVSSVSTESPSLQSKPVFERRKPLILKCSMCRKDKTMIYILQTLQRLENKFDTLYVSKPSTPASNTDWSVPQSGPRPPGVNGVMGPTASNESHMSSDSEVRPGARVGSQSSSPPDMLRTYQHLTVAYKVLLWPSIYLHILNSGIAVASDLQYVLQEGTPWFIHLELQKHPKPLPWDTDMRTYPMPSSTGEMRAGFIGLTPENMRRMCDAYFSTFNILFPILDRQMFLEDVLEPVLRNGFAGCDPQSCLVLLVLALGQTAIDGVYGSPISIVEGNPSGLRGGTAERPPGLNLFNEARRCMGFIMHQCTLENVQIHLLES